MVEGFKPPEFQRAVHVRLRQLNTWKADPYLVMDIMLEEAHAWRQLELYGPKPRASPKILAREIGDKIPSVRVTSVVS